MIAVAPMVAGCAVVDQYSGRAIGYNLEAEQAQQQALLLNIVRASKRRPMQFTGLTTITGSASASIGGGVSSIPIGPHSNLSPKIGTVTGSIGGGPNFVVPVLDTQEFYQGILNPIPGQILDLFFNAGYSRELILDLFVEKIVMRRTDSGCSRIDHSERCEFIFLNYVTVDPHYDRFQILIEYLLNLGLRSERVAGSVKKSSGDAPAAPPLSSFVLCFAPPFARYHAVVPERSRCGAQGIGQRAEARADSYNTSIKMPSDIITALQDVTRRYAEPDDAAMQYSARRLEWFRNKPVSLTFHTRHTERVFYYLGEIVSRQLETRNRRVIQFRTAGGGQYEQPAKPCSDDPRGCHNILVLRTDGGPAFLSTSYDGVTYSIPDDQDVAGRSYFVLDVLKQLLAINTSAKSLPASNVISVINAQ